MSVLFGGILAVIGMLGFLTGLGFLFAGLRVRGQWFRMAIEEAQRRGWGEWIEQAVELQNARRAFRLEENLKVLRERQHQ